MGENGSRWVEMSRKGCIWVELENSVDGWNMCRRAEKGRDNLSEYLYN